MDIYNWKSSSFLYSEVIRNTLHNFSTQSFGSVQIHNHRRHHILKPFIDDRADGAFQTSNIGKLYFLNEHRMNPKILFFNIEHF